MSAMSEFMEDKKHANAGMSIACNSGQAIQASMLFNNGMDDDGWKTRLTAAINHNLQVNNRSANELSIIAGLGRNYLADYFNTGREPKLPAFLKLCRAMGVSPIYILLGVELDPQAEELLSVWRLMTPEEREALLRLIELRQQLGPR